MDRDDVPDWWPYPLRCPAGHPWKPGSVLCGNHPCDCPSARSHFNRHRIVRCDPPGEKCDAAWFDPPCAYQPG